LASAKVSQKITYDEYGNVLTNIGQDITPFFFAGGLYEEVTGLTRFGARDYDAKTGRWTAKDPILFKGGQANLYVYCSNNPLNYIDLTGFGRWGYRQLGAGFPLYINNIDENLNTVAGHEHYWFDNGENFGYGPRGVFPELPSERSNYIFVGEYFDDNIMREAINNLKNISGDRYFLIGARFSQINIGGITINLGGLNCQDWADMVRQEYYRLKKEKEGNKCPK